MMLIMVERALDSKKTDDENLSEQVETEIRRKILVRCQVEILDYGSLPRTERKSKRVFDHRNNS
jgi:phenylacetate-CoA ligase